MAVAYIAKVQFESNSQQHKAKPSSYSAVAYIAKVQFESNSQL